MNTFGFISLKPTAEHQYFTEVAKRSQKFDFECFRFTPTDIDPVTHIVSGEIFDHSTTEWKVATFPIPKILYDRCFYQEDQLSKTSKSIVNWLKRRQDLFFLGYGLPNKWRIYESLIHSPLSPYLVNTHLAQTPEQVLSALSQHRKLILKPISGSGGMGIVCLEMDDNRLSVIIEKQHQLHRSTFPTIQDAHKWIRKLLTKKEYLIQPFLELTDSQNRPFDLRIFLQKNGSGQWIERAKAIRVGQKDGILSNLRAGAVTTPFQPWLDSLSPSTRSFLLEEIKEITYQLPLIIEKAFSPPFELGIDIGVGKDFSLWILDINSKPGRKIVIETQPESKESLYSAPLEYGKYLTLTHQKEGNIYEKTLPNSNR